MIHTRRAAIGWVDQVPHGDGTYAQALAEPLAALAFDADHFAGLLTEQGLYIERALYGSWPGRPHHASGQTS